MPSHLLIFSHGTRYEYVPQVGLRVISVVRIANGRSFNRLTRLLVRQRVDALGVDREESFSGRKTMLRAVRSTGVRAGGRSTLLVARGFSAAMPEMSLDDESSTPEAPSPAKTCLVNSHNEWDTLEEVIVDPYDKRVTGRGERPADAAAA